MHAIKGGWVGQTFALAKSNESEGRKSRIRRSKEERKAMVESFIKKYQKLNNGNFPSLNLTHKEVGGSFYTVREIVRDIIQENRVLGPAKLTREEQSTNQLEVEPLGSIATAPQYPLTILPNDHQLATNEHQDSNGELDLVSDGHHTTLKDQIFDYGKVINGTLVDMKKNELGEPKDAETQGHDLVELEQNGDDESDKEADLVSDRHYACPEQKMFDDELVVNGNQVDAKTKESDEQTQIELQVGEPSKIENFEEDLAASRSKVTPIAANVIVETFPLRPVTRTSDLDGRVNEETNMVNALGEQDLKKVKLAAGIGSSQTGRIKSSEDSSLMDEKEVTKLSNPLLDENSCLIDEEGVEKHRDPLLESSSSSNEGTGHEIQDVVDNTVKASSKDLTSKTVKQGEAVARAKVVNATNGINPKYIESNGGISEQLKIEKELIENEVSVQHGDSPQKGSNPPLDRINLESWEVTSKKSVKPDGNPLWAAFKAFINSFMKFWSE